MSILLLAALQLLTHGVQCQVQTTDGQLAGELSLLSPEQMMVNTADGATVLAMDRVLRITCDGEAAKSLPPLLVGLRDGSQLAAGEFTAEGANTKAQIGEVELSLPAATVQFVRFSRNAELNTPWQEVLGRQHQGDTLVIRKGGDALDFLEGAIATVTPELVKFRYEGEIIDVRRSKLEGIIYYGRDDKESAAQAAAKVTLFDGSLWKAQRVWLDGQQLRLANPSGLEFEVPITAVKNVDFGDSRLVFLSDLEPALISITPWLASSVQANLDRLLYAPQKDRAFGGGRLQLRLDGGRRREEFSKGLAVHSRTELEYRLSGRFQRLQGLAGIDPLAAQGALRLEISADGQLLLDETLESRQEPLVLDLDVSGKRRLRILVDFGDGLDVADRLNLCDLRVIK